MQGLYSLIIIYCAMVGDVLFNINTMALIVIGVPGYLATFDIWLASQATDVL